MYRWEAWSRVGGGLFNRIRFPVSSFLLFIEARAWVRLPMTNALSSKPKNIVKVVTTPSRMVSGSMSRGTKEVTCAGKAHGVNSDGHMAAGQQGCRVAGLQGSRAAG